MEVDSDVNVDGIFDFTAPNMPHDIPAGFWESTDAWGTPGHPASRFWAGRHLKHDKYISQPHSTLLW